MSNPQKDLRKQLRNVVQELLPEAMNKELHDALYKELCKTVTSYLERIQIEVREAMEKIEQRQKDTLSYLVRQVTNPPGMDAAPPAPTADAETLPETPANG